MIESERQRKMGGSPWPRYEEAALGFRNYWYPAMLSHHLRRRPVALQILGEPVLFTRYQGKCFALEDRCAHRGIPLPGQLRIPRHQHDYCGHGGTIPPPMGMGADDDGPVTMSGKAKERLSMAERKGGSGLYR